MFKVNKGLIKKFPNMYQFCDGDINKFVLLPTKGVDSNETSLPDKKSPLQ